MGFKYDNDYGTMFSLFAREFRDHLALREMEEWDKAEEYPVLCRSWCHKGVSCVTTWFTERAWDCCSSCRCGYGVYKTDERESRLMSSQGTHR